MKKYLVIPGFVISQYDGDKHFISSLQLIRLYRVRREECIICDTREMLERRYQTSSLHEISQILNRQYNNSNLIVLHPRYDGDYYLQREDN